MSQRIYPVGNCVSNPESVRPTDPCRINTITHDNKILNSFHSVPNSYDLKEGFNICEPQRLI